VSAAQTSCQAGQAQILVGDGYLQNLCGCQETPGIVNPPAVFQCTVPVNTSVLILFLANVTDHELVPQAGSSFVPSPISNPNDDLPSRGYAQSFSTAGTYGFVDAFNASVTGKIVSF
jgi:hypothetical protein